MSVRRRDWRRHSFALSLAGVAFGLALVTPWGALAADDASRKADSARKDVVRYEEKVAAARAELETYERKLQEAKAELRRREGQVKRLKGSKGVVEDVQVYGPGWRRAKANVRNNIAHDIEAAEDEVKDLEKEIRKLEGRVESSEKKVLRYQKYLAKAEVSLREAERVAGTSSGVAPSPTPPTSTPTAASSSTPTAAPASATTPGASERGVGGDGMANLRAGVALCLEENRWAEGLPLLANGGNEHLAKVARLELAGPAKPVEFLMLGKAWASLAQHAQNPTHKQAIRARAAHWLRQVLPHVPPLQRAALEKRIDALLQPAE